MTLNTGKLGSIDMPVGIDHVLYTCGAGAGNTAVAATATVAFCNRGTTLAKVRLAIGSADVPTAADYIEYDFELGAKAVLERTGIVVSKDERIIVRSDTANVSARTHGFEK